MAADFLRFPLHRTGGERLEDLLAWATGEVSRYKLQPILTSLSVDEVAGTETFVSYQEALSHLGSVQAEPSASVVMPGQAVRLDLQDPRLRYDKAAGRYTYIYQDAAGQLHTVWLSTPSDLAAQLDQVLRYQLGGVTIRGLLEPGNAPGMTDVVRSYRDQALAQVPPSLQVLWTVQGPEGPVQETRPLDSPSYEWTVPDQPGQQVVIAAALQGSGAVPLGEVALRIATPTPEATPTPTAMPAAAAGITSTVGATPTPIAADCLDAAFVADVTIPDDTQLDNGAAFEKTWRLSNNGSCEWPADTVLAFVSGEPMGAPASVTVGPVAPGKSVDITVKMTAPAEPGRYRGYWQLQAGGTTFGDQVYVQIIAGELPTPTPGAPPPSSPPPVARGNFELGGHIRTWNYVQQMKYAGMTWAKTQVHYGQDASGWINAAHANGFKIQLSALGRPDMVTQPGFEQSFATWVASLAAAGADAIEVWNEPNIDREWQIGYISPQAYTNLLCTAYQAIKAANPNTLVISAAPAPTGYFGGCSPNGCDDQPWMEGLYNAGAANCMDFIGAHHNAGATSPSARSGHPADQTGHHSWYFLPQTELYYNIFRGTRQLFYTEMGYASQEGVPPFSDMFAWARGTNNAQQAAWLAEAVRLSISTGMVRAIIVWNIDFPRYGYDPQDGYAIIRPDGSCPACETLHQVMGGGG
ncbi:MAG TPA: hypothetical protein ENK56_06230 [Chloroflexi bacterium]|nr:hypothetical protein [Chloroflexota bacterium]